MNKFEEVSVELIDNIQQAFVDGEIDKQLYYKLIGEKIK